MQRSANVDPRLLAVAREVEDLERACAEVERAMLARSWERIGEVLCDARRLQHALQNAMDDAAEVRTAAFDEQVFARLRRLFSVRENQIARMRHYRSAVAERLNGIGKLKAVARRLGVERAKPRLGALDRLS